LLYTLPTNGLALQASRTRISDAFRPRPSFLPPLTSQQIEALDALHVIGQEVAHRFAFRSGEMVFFNNLRMMHARDAFVDGCEAQNTTKRYVMRLILRDGRNPGWEVPPEMEETWRELYEHQDGDEVIPVWRELMSRKATH
jgi:hypothetical protein